jgi:D-serine deaminase-like pyridoxal phosphate-dependent protein
MAMSRDRGTQRQKVDYGYGAVCDANGRPLSELVMAEANQEHGIVARRDSTADPAIADGFPPGTQLRILPNHACATATQFGDYRVIAQDGAAHDTWRRFDGW